MMNFCALVGGSCEVSSARSADCAAFLRRGCWADMVSRLSPGTILDSINVTNNNNKKISVKFC